MERVLGEAATTYDLQFDGLAFQLDCSNLEVYTDSRYVRFRVGVVCETEEKTTLWRNDGSVSFDSSLHRKRNKKSERQIQTLPTPESPMRRSLKR